MAKNTLLKTRLRIIAELEQENRRLMDSLATMSANMSELRDSKFRVVETMQKELDKVREQLKAETERASKWEVWYANEKRAKDIVKDKLAKTEEILGRTVVQFANRWDTLRLTNFPETTGKVEAGFTEPRPLSATDGVKP